MNDNIFSDIPQILIWLTRLSACKDVRKRFLANPMAFASWYAVARELFTWPQSVCDIQAHERGRRLSFDRAVSLLSKVSHAFSGSIDLAYAKAVLEGHAVHSWASRHEDAFHHLLLSGGERVLQLYGTVHAPQNSQGESSFSRKLAELSTALGLQPLEKELFVFAVTASVAEDFRQVFIQLATGQRTELVSMWSSVFGCLEEDLFEALGPDSPLQVSGMLRAFNEHTHLPFISQFWVRVLVNGSDSILENLAEPLPDKSGSGIPARLSAEDIELATRLLKPRARPCDGINLLLYGADGLEKRAMLGQLTKKAGRTAWRLRKDDNARRDAPSVAYVTQRLLAKHVQAPVLVIEKPSIVLEQSGNELLRLLFGISATGEDEVRSFDELLLSSNPIPTVWLSAQPESLPAETVSRFVYHAPLQKATREDRQAQLESYVAGLRLSKATQKELLNLENVSVLQIETALRAVSLCGYSGCKERNHALLQTVSRSLKALRRDAQAEFKECVTTYSLDYLNCSGRFGPDQILKALRLRPRGSICLYGLPGTGKTQFVEYLAGHLGKRLMARRASELLSKFVGDNEKNIAKMFEEAADEEAILFLDEGDSFLRDRTRAQHEWEVTKVNELLQRMERFEGIFIMATNLFTGLDVAALRRFTFKLEFRELTAEQRWEMFLNETGLRKGGSEVPEACKEQWQTQLVLMQHLTAGDFATVKRQCALLGESLTPAEWLEQLRIECSVKSHGPG